MTIYLFGTNGILDNYIKAFLLHKNVDCVCITRNDVDASIVAAEKLFLVNSLLPNMLSSVVNQYKRRSIHITTDCVYSGSKGNYIECDQHDEANDYSVSKSLGVLYLL